MIDISLQLQDIGTAAQEMRDTANALKSSGSAQDIIKHFVAVRNAYNALGEAKKAINEIEDLLSREMVPDALRKENVKTITMVGIGRVTVSHRFSCSITDKDRGIPWLKDNGHGGLVQETVNSSTLAAFAKSMLVDEGKELPGDIFKTSTSPFTSITKA